MHLHRPPRLAFTLIELIVVVAIILVLIGLLLPAVQKVREAASRTRCNNNLKQLALAAHHYHGVHQAFPPGYVSNVTPNGDDTGPGWGWAAQLLPQIEQGTLANSIRFDLPIEDALNDNTPTWIAAHYDPAGTLVNSIAEVASANYAGVFGTGEPGVDGDGVFFRNSKISFGDITDGTSRTLLIGERTVRLGPTTWVGSVTGATIYAPQTGPQVEDAAGMVLGQANHPPGSPNCELNEFASRHPGGANFAFADGHVAFIISTVSQGVFHALATRAAGEALGEGN
jgi:prepilin-type processing-associated H-X9-DG protein/prepilin-type N-terminal cleavage/methylation domain-containing protein